MGLEKFSERKKSADFMRIMITQVLTQEVQEEVLPGEQLSPQSTVLNDEVTFLEQIKINLTH